MLGSTPIQAVLGAGIDNRDHDAVKAFLRSAADIGLSVLFIYPDSKVPCDLRTVQKRNADDKLAQAEAQAAGRKDWATVKSAAGLALATTDKTTLDRYLKRYIELFSTWWEVTADGSEGEQKPWTKKAVDSGEITMRVPAAVNLAVEVGQSGLVVVDCDTAGQVRRWFEANDLDPDDPDLPPPTVVTPGHRGADADPDDPSTWAHSDGGHFYFTVTDRWWPVLPRNIGALTWGGDNGFAVLWDRRYVLIPPSTRPEGAYELVGRDYELPDWLAEKIVEAGTMRAERADRNAEAANPELATAVDMWAEGLSWRAILEPLGWTPAPRADSCGCEVWTAPGIHASPKSATAHGAGCTAGRYTEVNAPLHIWTDNPAEPFATWCADKHTSTISKLQAVALISYGGSVGKAMDELDLLPEATSVDPDVAPRQPDPDHGIVGDGEFELPHLDPCICTIDIRDGKVVDYDCGRAIQRAKDAPDPEAGAYDYSEGPPVEAVIDGEDNTAVCACGKTITPDDAYEGEDGEWYHNGHSILQSSTVVGSVPAADNAAKAKLIGEGIIEPTAYVDHDLPPLARNYEDVDVTISHDPADLPADFGKAPNDSPYPDRVDDPDPDVFDSVHAGVPRIAPFSHWREMPPPEFVVDGLIEHGGLSCIIGPPGVGKSTIALDMACHVATGKRWQGRQTLKTKVLYLPGEGLAGAVQRLRAWEAAHNVALDDNLLLGNGIILVKATNEAWGEIAGYIARQEIGLVIFDTFARMSSGLEENSATDVGTAIRRFDKLKELTNAGVCVVHHTAKGAPDVARGSSALNGALDSELLVRGATWDVGQVSTDANGRMPGKPIELWTTKQKNIEQLDDAIPLMLIDVNAVIDLDPDNGPGIIKAPIITGPNCAIDPMQGEIVLARALPEPLVETAIRIREYVDRLPQQGATRGDMLLAIRPDTYSTSRNDAAAYWKQRIAEAVDRGLRYGLIETLTGTPSGARYIPSVATADQARAAAAAEVNDAD